MMQPEKYDNLVVVLWPKSKLREADDRPEGFRFYRFASEEVSPWRMPKGNYCAKGRIRKCTRKHTVWSSGEGTV